MIQQGTKFHTNYGECEVLDDRGWKNVLVRFTLTKYETTTSRQSLEKGHVRDPYFPSVCGVGYFGEGIFKSRTANKITREYNTWCGMLHRCYDENRQEKDKTYRICSVDPLWHNFQNFAHWFVNQKLYTLDSSELDKDLLVANNKVYSPTSCCLLPKKINSTLAYKREGSSTTGVWFCEEEGKYRVTGYFEGKPKILGRYDHLQEAYDVFKNYKENYVRLLADEFKDSLDPDVYLELKKWTFRE